MSATDATPSWSGYIFQGEVALCKAIEAINAIGARNLQDNYCLRLEQDEDFSIKTSDIEVFQVKAYLSQNSDKVSKYKDTIEELINKYFYSTTKIKDKIDRRKSIRTYSILKRKQPIKCSLISHKEITDYTATLTGFNQRFTSIDFDYFRTIHGEYSLDNINDKLNQEIENFFGPTSPQPNRVEKIRNHCCQKISNYVKERHSTKKVRVIPFSEIIEWLKKSNFDDEDFAWFQVEKIFTDALLEDLGALNTELVSERLEHERLSKCLFHLERIDREGLQSLINRITPHKTFGYGFDMIDSGSVKNIISKSIRKVLEEPHDYKKLLYSKDSEIYQLSTIIENPDISLAKQELVEKIGNNNIIDVSYYITNLLKITKEEIQESRLIHIVDHESLEAEEDEEGEKQNETKPFELIPVNEAIPKLNT